MLEAEGPIDEACAESLAYVVHVFGLSREPALEHPYHMPPQLVPALERPCVVNCDLWLYI